MTLTNEKRKVHNQNKQDLSTCRCVTNPCHGSIKGISTQLLSAGYVVMTYHSRSFKFHGFRTICHPQNQQRIYLNHALRKTQPQGLLNPNRISSGSTTTSINSGQIEHNLLNYRSWFWFKIASPNYLFLPNSNMKFPLHNVGPKTIRDTTELWCLGSHFAISSCKLHENFLTKTKVWKNPTDVFKYVCATHCL